jgi:23S rRNA G2445 N2-methylase RlmL
VEGYILLEQKDFFSLDGEYVESRILAARKDSVDSNKRFLVLNPPYGKRLDVEPQYLTRMWEHIRKGFPHWKILLLAPASVDLSLLSSAKGKKFVFRHGGLRVQALFLEND